MTPLQRAQSFLSDVEYLERMLAETCQGVDLLRRQAELLAQDHEVYSEAIARLSLVTQLCVVAQSSSAESFRSLTTSLATYIEQLEQA